MLSKYFFGFIISFALGVGFENIFYFGFYFGVFLFILAIISAIARGARIDGSSSYAVSLVFVILLGFALGVLRVDVSASLRNTDSLVKYAEKQVIIEGIVLDEPDVRERYTNIVLKINRISEETERPNFAESTVLYERDKNVLKKSENILVRTEEYPVFHYGDEIFVKGKISRVKNFKSKDGEKDFDYQAFLAKDNIYYQMYFPEIVGVKNGQGNFVQEKLFELKNLMLKNIGLTIKEPEAALAGGITLGAKQSLGEDLLQKFRETGLVHIVVLSGYNIAVVVVAIGAVTYLLPFVWRIVVSVFGIILFAMMVGGGATVIRATIMALVVILARVAGRENDALRALFFAGGLMVFFNPMILLNDISFQLSFVATLSLVIFAPFIEKYFLFVKNKVLSDILTATISTQIFVLPLLLYYMGSASAIGAFANLLVLPVVPIAMLFVFLTGVFAWVPLLGNILGSVAYFILAYIIYVAEFFSSVPFAHFSGISFSLGMLCFAYTILGIVSVNYFLKQQRDKK